MESHDVRLARIEEGIVSIKGDMLVVRRVIEKTYDHDKEIALLKRDRKWETRISHSISGMIGAIFIGAITWFKK